MSDIDPSAVAWLGRYAELLGVQAPRPSDVDIVLALAGEAAHRSHRQAAPVACWLAATAGLSPQQACDLAREVTL